MGMGRWMTSVSPPGPCRLAPPATLITLQSGPDMTNARGGARLGRIAGVEVRLDWSLLVVFWLILVNLGLGLFPARHPDWSPAMSWAVAAVAAILFLASILAH